VWSDSYRPAAHGVHDVLASFTTWPSPQVWQIADPWTVYSPALQPVLTITPSSFS